MIRFLEWDSRYFHKNIADISYDSISADWNEFDRLVSAENISIVQCLCPIGRIETIHMLESNGFHYYDTKVDFTLDLLREPLLPFSSALRMAGPEDSPALESIARSIFTVGRYFNECFPKEESSEFYAEWIRKAIEGTFDDYCLILGSGLDIQAFVTIKEIDKLSRIGLLGVNDSFTGTGCGSLLLGSLIGRLRQNGLFDQLAVSTQGSNLGAMNLYLKAGFRIDSVQNWYYKSIE